MRDSLCCRLSPHSQYQSLTMGAVAAASPRPATSNANAACQTSTVTAEVAEQLGLLLMFNGDDPEEVAETELVAADANDEASAMSADDEVVSAN